MTQTVNEEVIRARKIAEGQLYALRIILYIEFKKRKDDKTAVVVSEHKFTPEYIENLKQDT